MPFSVSSRVENEIAILDLEGSLTLGPGLQVLREATKRSLAESRPKGLVLNVAKLVTADSAGLGELTVVYTVASRQGCGVALAAPAPNLINMLQVTHLDELLPSAADIAAASALAKNR